MVLIEWLDSRSPFSGWEWLDEREDPQPSTCTTVGWLVKESADGILVAPTIADVDADAAVQISGGTVIARRAITRIQELVPIVNRVLWPEPCLPDTGA